MKAHPLSEIFPLMVGEDLQTLAADIKANGLREPVVVYDGMILDGRNRYAACKLAKVRPETVDYQGGYKDAELLAYVVSRNLHRRHLTIVQRAFIAAEMAKKKPGNPRLQENAKKPGKSQSGKIAGLENPGVSQQNAAELLDVSERSVRDAAAVLANGTPEQVEAVKAGDTPLAKAAQEVRDKGKGDEAPADPLEAAAKAYTGEVNLFVRKLDELVWNAKELEGHALGRCVHWHSIIDQLKAARGAAATGRPKYKCPYCKATGTKDGRKCRGCDGQAWVHKTTYKSGCAAMGSPDDSGGDDE